MLKTIVHKLASDGSCILCRTALPSISPSHADLGEYVGVTTYGGQRPREGTIYRIGKNNKNARCDGAPAAEFFQDSEA